MTHIQVLPAEEARKIAAGEVVDRPSALVREFMDNAIDAGASLLEVSIEAGGIISVEVSDDGSGMSREDLELCCLTHATSKIRSLSDLDSAETLGFRGEALAAVASVSRVEILSSQDSREAWKFETDPAGHTRLEQSRRTRGTSVRALGLFDTIPARKRFLKRPGSEASACYEVFCEKAMAFPEKAFRFFKDQKLKSFFPKDPSYKERFGRIALEGHETQFLREITAHGSGFQVVIVFGQEEISRPDRRRQYVFTNRRRIQDFSLLQALEYGLRGLFPNATHPVGAIFITIDPSLADFNIHPAKREVRFVDSGSIHHAITSALESFRRRTAGVSFEPPGGEEGPFPQNRESSLDFYAPPREWARDGTPGDYIQSFAKEARPAYEPKVSLAEAALEPGEPKFIGRLFNLFILIEKGETLFIIDQHAAHERILYNRFIEGPIPQQELLVAIPFWPETAEDHWFLKTRQEDLARLGIRVAEDGEAWRIEALPADWRLSSAETVAEILSLKTAGTNLAEHWAAALSCKKAIKDGDFLDSHTSLALARDALALPDPRCPHGRPVWTEIRREDLLRLVKRT